MKFISGNLFFIKKLSWYYKNELWILLYFFKTFYKTWNLLGWSEIFISFNFHIYNIFFIFYPIWPYYNCSVRLQHGISCALFSLLHHFTSLSHVQIKSVHCLVTNQFSFISHAEAQPGSARIVMTNNFSPSNAWYEKQHNHFTIFFIFSYFSVYYKCGCLQ